MLDSSIFISGRLNPRRNIRTFVQPNVGPKADVSYVVKIVSLSNRSPRPARITVDPEPRPVIVVSVDMPQLPVGRSADQANERTRSEVSSKAP